MPSVTDMFLNPDIHPDVPSLGPSSGGFNFGGLLDKISPLAGLAKSLIGGGGGTNVRQSTSVSQATNVAVNPIINNIIGSGTGGGTTSGYATGSPSASASVAGDTLPGYMPSSGYGATLYGGRPYGSISAYDTLPVSPSSVGSGPDLGTMLLLGAVAVGVFLFVGK
jgi:hypothetical protein